MATAILPPMRDRRRPQAPSLGRRLRSPLLEPEIDPGMFLSLPPEDEAGQRHECRREAHEHVEEP